STGNVKRESPKRDRKRARDRAGELKRELRGREVSLLRWLGIQWPGRKKNAHINCPFPGHEDIHPSWRCDNHKAAWFCSKCGGGDIFRAIQELKGADFPGACQIVEQFLGYDVVAPAFTKHRPQRDTEQQGKPADAAGAALSEADLTELALAAQQ